MIDDIYAPSASRTQALQKKTPGVSNTTNTNPVDPRESVVDGMRTNASSFSSDTVNLAGAQMVSNMDTGVGAAQIFQKPIKDNRGNTVGFTYFAKNNSNLPLELGVGLDERGQNINYKTSTELNFIKRLNDGGIDPKSLAQFALKPGESIKLFDVGAKEQGRWGIAPYFLPGIGSKDAKHDDKVRYLAPFPKGTPWRVSQGENNSDGSHKPGTENAFSIDFVTDESDTEKKVTAMRSGTVVKIKEDSNEGGPKVDSTKANEVWVLHEDGSIAKYIHLKQGSATKAGIKVGSQIKAGQGIGNYGLTGKTDGPHLHVQVDLKGLQGEEYISIAHRFQGPDGSPVQKLQTGTESVAAK